jgi:hypothetical protein
MTIKLPNDELIPDDELAAQWHCTTRTLRRYEHEPNGLPYVIVGGRKYRPKTACSAWLAARIKHPNPARSTKNSAA